MRMVSVGAGHAERCTRRDTDAVGGEGDDGALFVGDVDPHVQTRARRRRDPAGRGRRQERSAALRRRLPRRRTDASIPGSVSIASRIRWVRRLVHDGPSRRRLTIGSRTAAGPPMRRDPQIGTVGLREAADVHGPDRGGGWPRCATRRPTTSPEWSSSTTSAVGGLEDSGDRRRPASASKDAPVGLCARGWTNTADGAVLERGGAARRRSHAVVVDGHADDAGSGELEHVEQRRERRILDHDGVAEADVGGDDAVEGVLCAVDDGQRLGPARPAAAQLVLEVRAGPVGRCTTSPSTRRAATRGPDPERGSSAGSGVPVLRSSASVPGSTGTCQ